MPAPRHETLSGAPDARSVERILVFAEAAARTRPYLAMHLAYVAALFNALLALNCHLAPNPAPQAVRPRIAQYAL